jgi:hypothetical protein
MAQQLHGQRQVEGFFWRALAQLPGAGQIGAAPDRGLGLVAELVVDRREALARLRAEIEAARIDLAASTVPPGVVSLWGRPAGPEESITA